MTSISVSPGVNSNDKAHAAACSQVVFIDAGVQDRDPLLGASEPGSIAYALDASRDGVRQMAEILGQHANLSAVSVIAHGEAGRVTLGAVSLEQAGLAPSLRAARCSCSRAKRARGPAAAPWSVRFPAPPTG